MENNQEIKNLLLPIFCEETETPERYKLNIKGILFTTVLIYCLALSIILKYFRIIINKYEK